MENKEKVIIGTWSLSGDFGNVPLSQIEAVLNRAYELGFYQFDAAPSYGNGFVEFAIGKIFSGKTSDLKFDTKVGNHPFIGKSFTNDDVKRSVDQSLKRLQVDMINTLYLHNPRTEVKDYGKLLNLLKDLKSQGVINNIGLSCAKGYEYPSEVYNEFDYIQNDFNLLYVSSFDSIKNSSSKFVARSPLASGILSGRLSEDSTFNNDDHRSGWLKGERLLSLIERVNAIKNAFPNTSIPTLAKLFPLNVLNIDKVIYGVKSVEHINSLDSDIQDSKITKDDVSKIISMCENDFGLINQKHLGY
ncbi:MAG: aldo/keto reductase [Bacteroidales bacterium]|nr:aldo/keto reductase [Bacteroidales bacterium]